MTDQGLRLEIVLLADHGDEKLRSSDEQLVAVVDERGGAHTFAHADEGAFDLTPRIRHVVETDNRHALFEGVIQCSQFTVGCLTVALARHQANDVGGGECGGLIHRVNELHTDFAAISGHRVRLVQRNEIEMDDLMMPAPRLKVLGGHAGGGFRLGLLGNSAHTAK